MTMEKARDGQGQALRDTLQDAKTLIAGFIDAQVVRRGLDWRTGEAYRIDLEHFYKWLDGKEGQKADIGTRQGLWTEQQSGTGQGLGTEQQPWPGQGLGAGQKAGTGEGACLAEELEAYLEYLALEKRLRPSTVARKSRVFNYYLSYLVRQGLLLDRGPLKLRRAAGRPQHREWDANSPADAVGQGVPDGSGSTKGLSGAVGPGDPGGFGAVHGARALRGIHDREDIDRYGIDRYGLAAERMTKTDVDAFFLALEREYDELDSDFRRRVCLRDLVMMELLFYHGIEVSELLRLEVSDYDQKTGVLTIRKKRGKVDSIYLYSRALRERMERWIAEHGYFEREEAYREKLFLSKLGRPLSMKMVINIFDKYRVLAGVEKEFTPKDLKRCMGEYARELMREWCG